MPVEAPPADDELPAVPVEPPVRVLVPAELPPLTSELLLAAPELALPPVLLDPPALVPPELDVTPELMAPPDPVLPAEAEAPPVPPVVEPSFEEQLAISMVMVVVSAGNQPRTLWALIMFSSWAWARVQMRPVIGDLTCVDRANPAARFLAHAPHVFEASVLDGYDASQGRPLA